MDVILLGVHIPRKISHFRSSKIDIFLVLKLNKLYHVFSYTYYAVSLLGLAYRRCLENGTWDHLINVTQCKNTEYTNLQDKLNKLEYSPSNIVDVVRVVESISKELKNLTNTSNGVFFPNDLNTTIGIINTITRLLQCTFICIHNILRGQTIEIFLWCTYLHIT